MRCARSGRPSMTSSGASRSDRGGHSTCRRPDATAADPPRQASRPQEWGVVRSGRQALPAATFRDFVEGPVRGAPVTASKNCGASPANVTKTVLPSGENPYAGSVGVLVEPTTDEDARATGVGRGDHGLPHRPGRRCGSGGPGSRRASAADPLRRTLTGRTSTRDRHLVAMSS